MTGRDIRLALVALVALTFCGGVVMVAFAAVPTVEAFGPFGLALALLGGQHLPPPEPPE